MHYIQVMFNSSRLYDPGKSTCMWDLDKFLLITSARYWRTLSRVSLFLRSARRTSRRPSYKLFIRVLIVVNEDNKSAGRRFDASEKHCWLVNSKINVSARSSKKGVIESNYRSPPCRCAIISSCHLHQHKLHKSRMSQLCHDIALHFVIVLLCQIFPTF